MNSSSLVSLLTQSCFLLRQWTVDCHSGPERGSHSSVVVGLLREGAICHGMPGPQQWEEVFSPEGWSGLEVEAQVG